MVIELLIRILRHLEVVRWMQLTALCYELWKLFCERLGSDMTGMQVGVSSKVKTGWLKLLPETTGSHSVVVLTESNGLKMLFLVIARLTEWRATSLVRRMEKPSEKQICQKTGIQSQEQFQSDCLMLNVTSAPRFWPLFFSRALWKLADFCLEWALSRPFLSLAHGLAGVTRSHVGYRQEKSSWWYIKDF